MNPYYLLVPVLLPMVTGAAVLGLRPKERRKREILVMGGILAASAVIGALVLNRPGQPLVLYRFGSRMNISLGLDGLSGVFACLIAVLWPLTALYSFEYMKHEGKENKFFNLLIWQLMREKCLESMVEKKNGCVWSVKTRLQE